MSQRQKCGGIGKSIQCRLNGAITGCHTHTGDAMAQLARGERGQKGAVDLNPEVRAEAARKSGGLLKLGMQPQRHLPSD
ncbi:hypothetical protein KCP69_19135 [Salmonella enterica subsp. enterica]|nr:hypothetical protein KCP69_19135 [Salmonella enterica subsp. enterica]